MQVCRGRLGIQMRYVEGYESDKIWGPLSMGPVRPPMLRSSSSAVQSFALVRLFSVVFLRQINTTSIILSLVPVVDGL